MIISIMAPREYVPEYLVCRPLPCLTTPFTRSPSPFRSPSFSLRCLL